MKAEEQKYSSLRFSTRSLPASKRLPALRELFERSIQLEIDAAPGQAVEMEMHLAPGLRRAKMLSSFTARTSRPTSMLADGEDTICLMMKMGGYLELAQGHQESVPKNGDGVLLVYREPSRLQFVGATYVSVRVPFAAISTVGCDAGAAAGRRIPRDTEALSLLRNYVMNLPERVTDPQLGRLSATHVYDLIALAIGATNDGRAIALQRGVRAARLEAIKSDLIHNVALDLKQLAKRQGISTRYIQILFEESGTTFTEFALARRLEFARAILTSPRYRTWSVTAIALEAGFGDISHFNRCFKRRYSMTPTDMRAHLKNNRTPG